MNFPGTTVVAFLDSLFDCLKEVDGSKIDSNVRSCVSNIGEDLAFLISFMGILMELRKDQEGLHKGLWNLCVEMACKLEFIVDQLVLGNVLESFARTSFPSTAADMRIIKIGALKILDYKGQLKVRSVLILDEGLKQVRDMEITSQRIISIHSAVIHVQSFVEGYQISPDYLRNVMNRLRCLRTFVLLSIKLVNNYQLRGLLRKVDDIVLEIFDHEFSTYHGFEWFVYRMEPLQRDMERWFMSLSNYDLQQCSSSPMATRVKDILVSLSENIEDFQSYSRSWEFDDFEDHIDALKESITFLTSFITFASHICADQHQEIQDIFTQIEDIAISATHLIVLLYAQDKQRSAHIMEPIISALQLRIKPFQNHHFYAPALLTKDDSLIAMTDSINSLLSLLWNMLLSDVALVDESKSPLEKFYLGLRSLKSLLRKQPNEFDDKLMDMTRLAICNAGVVIFSLDQKDFEIDHDLQEFQVILKKVEERVIVPTSAFKYPRTFILGYLDFLLEYLTEVERSKFDSDTLNYVSKIPEDLSFLRLFMGKILELMDQPGDLHHALWNLGAATAYKIEFLIDQLVLGDTAEPFSISIQSIAEDMMIIRNDFTEVFDVRRQEIDVQKTTWAYIHDQVASQSSTGAFNNFVGCKSEQTSIMNRLKRGSKNLQVVSIVGMPGLGKTTLATKVYNEPSVADHFTVRAWYSISQVLNKRKALIELLNCIQKKDPNEYAIMTENDLAEELRHSLKGRRYLIFLDDVWEIQTYNWLQIALPDDSTGSRIILTTRQGDVAKLDDKPVSLSQFTPEESLELLRRKVSVDRIVLPPETRQLEIQIAESCKGLPLTIVIVAGLLTASKHEVWTDVLQSLRSGLISNTDQCESTIELSYNYLPDHLKQCFLSFAAFPEDHEISVKRLIWMWIAEGFVRKGDLKRLEEAATNCLNILIGRNLVMKAKERSTGGVKACRMHDLLRDFCLKKANEEFYMHQLQGHEELLSCDDPGNMRRLCISSGPGHFKKSKMYWPHLRSLLFSGTEKSCNWKAYDMTFIFRIFKLLRVLDMERVYPTYKSPSEIGFLVQLRYLATQVDSEVNPSIGNLSNLETLILMPRCYEVQLPGTFWNLQKLRHLYSIHGYIKLPVDSLESNCNLLNLDSLSTISSEDWGILEKQLRKFPNIRRLKTYLYGRKWNCGLVTFSFLMRLESLTLSFSSRDSYGCEVSFPNTIKKLDLFGYGWPWRKVSGIAGLPNLEVLKMHGPSFAGDMWHVEEEEFLKLRVLILSNLDFVKWTASYDQFQNLEKLVIEDCLKLREIPAECLEAVDTLELVEVKNCSDIIVASVEKVVEHQKEMGNYVLRLYVVR